LDLVFAREIEQLVTLRDVEAIEKVAETLRAMREHVQRGELTGAGIPIIGNPTRIPDERPRQHGVC
jgi:hypothetical protein